MEKILENVHRTYRSIEYDEKNSIISNSDFSDSYIIYGTEEPSNRGRWKLLKTHEDEKTFSENYANPRFCVHKTIKKIVLEKSENKISVKFFNITQWRLSGQAFFRKETKMSFITFNTKTSNLYFGGITNYHKKRKFSKKLSCNAFFKKPINKFFLMLRNELKVDHSSFDDVTSNSLVIKYYKTFAKLIGLDPAEYKKCDLELFRNNVTKKGFKLPNNYEIFSNIYPLFTKKDSKKSNGKFVDSVLERLGLKGGRFKKIFHDLNNFQDRSFIALKNSVGLDFIKKLPDHLIKKIFEVNDLYKYTPNYPGSESILISAPELVNNKNFFECFKLLLEDNINLFTFIDHIEFYKKISKYEKVVWKANDLNSFDDEHLEYSEKVEFYSNGNYTRTYDQKFIDAIQQPILENYYPVVLTDTKSYVDESSTQSNCVKTYLKKAKSFIVSLRNGGDRATLEYVITQDFIPTSTKKIVNMRRVQSLGRYNKGLDRKWEEPLKILDERITNYLENNEFISPKISVKFKNGLTYETELKFDEYGSAKWDKEESDQRVIIIDNIEMPF